VVLQELRKGELEIVSGLAFQAGRVVNLLNSLLPAILFVKQCL